MDEELEREEGDEVLLFEEQLEKTVAKKKPAITSMKHEISLK